MIHRAILGSVGKYSETNQKIETSKQANNKMIHRTILGSLSKSFNMFINA
jgi:threonyl-tRNA synthetase